MWLFLKIYVYINWKLPKDIRTHSLPEHYEKQQGNLLFYLSMLLNHIFYFTHKPFLPNEVRNCEEKKIHKMGMAFPNN